MIRGFFLRGYGYIIVNIETTEAQQQTTPRQYTTTDIAGKAVKQGNLNTASGNFIAFGNLANGAYFIRINSQNESLGTEKIILSR